MLTLRRLELEGFGLYAERSVVELPESGVTAIYGNNGRGKTTLMKAFRLALLGTPFGGQSATSNENLNKQWILDHCNRDLAAGGSYSFDVRLAVRHDEEEWEVARGVSLREPTAIPESDADFRLDASLRRADYVAGPAERDELLRAMMPADISRFFLFDGELLNQYAELLDNESEMGRRISESIEQILGVPLLKNARDHLEALSQKLSRDAATEASRDQATRALGTSLKAKHDEREAQKLELERAVTKRDELQVDRSQFEAEMRQQEVYAAAVERLDRARTDHMAAEQIEETKFQELQREMKDAWRTVLNEDVAKAKVVSQDAIRNAVEGLTHQLRHRAVNTRHCEVCDQALSEAHADSVGRMLPSVDGSEPTDQVARTALARSADLDRFQPLDVRRAVEAIWRDINEARMNRVDASGRITDAEATLGGRDEHQLRNLQDNYARVVTKLEQMQSAIAQTEARIVEIEKDIDRLERNLNQKGTVALADKQLRKDIAASARSVFAQAVDRYKEVLREKVETSATDLFLQMTTGRSDYSRLSINNHYGLSIMHNDGQTESGRSAGQEQVVALALIGALQANAPLSGPIVMDTPFGRLDNDHTRNVVTTLPSMAKQVVLLVQEGEIDRRTVRSHLGGSLVKEYELAGDSFRRTKIVEAR